MLCVGFGLACGGICFVIEWFVLFLLFFVTVHVCCSSSVIVLLLL